VKIFVYYSSVISTNMLECFSYLLSAQSLIAKDELFKYILLDKLGLYRNLAVKGALEIC